MAKKDPVRQEIAVPNGVPAFMQPFIGKGTEQLSTVDVEIPRIKLLQALNPELTEFNEARQGHFWHHIAEKDLGPSIKIVPIYVDQSFILWRPRKMGGGILARAMDGIHWAPDHGEFQVDVGGPTSTKMVNWKLGKTVAASGLAEWGSMDPTDVNSPPAATRMYNIVAVLPDDEPMYSPAVITLQRSAISVARKFLGKLKISQAPSFGQYYVVESVRDKNNANQEFWNYKFTMAGLVQDEEKFNNYRQGYEVFRAEGIKIRNLESLQDDEPQTTIVDDGKM